MVRRVPRLRAAVRLAHVYRLAARVDRVSETRGDGLGYDVLSFETSGRERLIEVKTTNYGAFNAVLRDSQGTGCVARCARG